MTDDQRCRTCKWWEQYDCQGRIHVCRRAESGYESPEDDSSLAYALDAGAYHAWLVTAPDFGCVQWEKKSDA